MGNGGWWDVRERMATSGSQPPTAGVANTCKHGSFHTRLAVTDNTAEAHLAQGAEGALSITLRRVGASGAAEGQQTGRNSLVQF